MHLTQFSDYSLRVLLYLGLKEEIATVAEISDVFKISRNHLVKVVHHLSKRGYINSFKGKNGGIELAISPEDIRIGDFIAEMEPLSILECFDRETCRCPIGGVCQLERSLYEAKRAFLQSLNQYTLADHLKPGRSRTSRMQRLGLKPS